MVEVVYARGIALYFLGVGRKRLGNASGVVMVVVVVEVLGVVASRWIRHGEHVVCGHGRAGRRGAGKDRCSGGCG